MEITIISLLSLFVLLTLATGVFFLAQKIRVPYSVLLVATGVILVPLTLYKPFSFLTAFELSPDLIFYVLLPILLFESAFHIPIRKFIDDIPYISILSIAGLLVSTAIIGFGSKWGLSLFGIDIPLGIALLFGSLISATDPIAVLALFKEYGAPRRLALLFEGESLFNDGTAMALFMIILAMIAHGVTPLSIGIGIITFFMLIIGGILFGFLMGLIFTKIASFTSSNEFVAITATLAMAHITFIGAELISQHVQIGTFDIHISPIIATVIASMMIGNYGKHKFSPRSEEFLEKFWGQSAFLANSIIFILIGLIAVNIPLLNKEILISIIIGIIITLIGRIISIYPITWFYNAFSNPMMRIPKSWQHIFAWGGLRGAIAITLVLLIPDSFMINGWHLSVEPKIWLLGITVGCIFASLFINATTIQWVMKKLHITRLTSQEQFEYYESLILTHSKMIARIYDLHSKHYISENLFERLKKYHTEKRNTYSDLQKKYIHGSEYTSNTIQSEHIIRLHAIGIEKHYLKELFMYHEVNEKVYKRILTKLTLQSDAFEQGLAQCNTSADYDKRDWFERIITSIKKLVGYQPYEMNFKEKYMYYRAQSIISRKVIKEFEEIIHQDFLDQDTRTNYSTIQKQYILFREQSTKKMLDLQTIDAVLFEHIETELVSKGLFKSEEIFLKNLVKKEMVSPKIGVALHNHFIQESHTSCKKDY